MSAAIDIRGLKRICADCGTRFYDMTKRPITCPSCETEFTGEIKLKTRRGRAVIEETPKPKATPVTKDEELEDETDAEEAKIVDLENLETTEITEKDEGAETLDAKLNENDDDLEDSVLTPVDDLGSLDELEPDAEEDLDEKSKDKTAK